MTCRWTESCKERNNKEHKKACFTLTQNDSFLMHCHVCHCDVAGKYHAKNQKIMFRNKVNLPLKQANTIIYLCIYVLCIHTQNIQIRLIFYYCHMIVMAQTMSKKKQKNISRNALIYAALEHKLVQVLVLSPDISYHVCHCEDSNHAVMLGKKQQHIQKWFSRIKKIMLHFDKIQFFDELPCL